MFKRIFSPRGRITAREFLIGLVVFVVAMTVFAFALNVLGNSMWGFFGFLIYLFALFQGVYGLYGKRLHDMDRSFWPLTGMIVSLFIVMLVVMLTYGGAEYFSGFAEFDRKEDIDPDVIAALQAEYQANLAKGVPVLNVALWGIIGLFSAWMVLGKSDPKENQYGPA